MKAESDGRASIIRKVRQISFRLDVSRAVSISLVIRLALWVGETHRDTAGRAGTRSRDEIWQRSTVAGRESIDVARRMRADGRAELRPQH